MKETYRIPQERWSGLQSKIERLGRKAAKLSNGKASLTVQGIEHETEWMCGVRDFLGSGEMYTNTGKDALAEHIVGATHEEQNCPKVIHEIVVVELEAEPIHLSGWEFLARQVREAGIITINAVPGVEVPQEFRETPSDRCDHCKSARYRNDTFLVRHTETGKVKQVGSTCLHDFLGHDPHRVARLIETLGRITYGLEEGIRAGYGSEPFGVGLVEFLAQTIAQVEESGWISRGKAHEIAEQEAGPLKTATADLAWNFFTANTADARRHFPRATDTHRQEAKASIEWAQALNPNGNDYELNIAQIAHRGWVTYRLAGYAGSIPAAMHRTQERQDERRAEEAQQAASEWVGEEKQRQEFKLTLKSERGWEGNYGYTWLYKFTDESGNILTWFASSALYDGEHKVVEGEEITLKGTVKSHNEYHGHKETQITRCKVVS